MEAALAAPVKSAMNDRRIGPRALAPARPRALHARHH